MVDYISKWNKYKGIEDIRWITKNRDHIAKKKFVEYVIESDVCNIVEVGAGDLTEGQQILAKKTIDYSIVDISPLFLNYVKEIEPQVKTYMADMISLPFENKQFDLIYTCSVLEHSPDILKTIKEFSRVSKSFYFTIFKWMNKSGGLVSSYNGEKGFFSTYFNIHLLIGLIEKYGTIKESFVCSPSKYLMKFEDYLKYDKDIDKHRNKNYLSLIGEWNG